MGRSSNIDQSKLARNIKDVHSWVSDQETASRIDARDKNAQNIANVLSTTVDAVDKLRSGSPVTVMSGCLDIIGSATALVGGPGEVVVRAICSILGGLLSAFNASQPDLATQIHKIIHAELIRFHTRLVRVKFSGLELRISNLMRDLSVMSSKEDVPHEAKTVPAELLQFVGEVSSGFKPRPLRPNASEEDKADVINAMVVYCYAQTCTRILLTVMLCKYHELKIETKYVYNMMETLKFDATDKLSFLSEERYMNLEGVLGEGNLYKIFELRQNNTALLTVEEFRRSMHLREMSPLETIQRCISRVGLSIPKLKEDGYPNLHTRNDHHYVQFINETDFPVKVVSGVVGNTINNLAFTQNIQPRQSYERNTCIPQSRWNFSAGGYFVVYLDGQLQPDEAPFNGENRAIEFALSNPLVGRRKVKVLDGTDENKFQMGSRCYNNMDASVGQPVYWVHNEINYMAVGYYTDGRNCCRTWRFIVQDFSPNDDANQTRV